MIDRTSASNIQSMLETIRAYQAQASGQAQKSEDTVAPKGVPSFTESVKNLIEKVNDAQVQSTRLQEAYQR
ncbi:MAG: flagellar hook-basal body complex protein FliE, partial [Betaproteobacteria bacterium]|nr:flagellar hook-basal body complex protein FliE [Betaproteobacteria bacterium]